jgi:FlaA1/EpsC-like NDP-sugar epimerase
MEKMKKFLEKALRKSVFKRRCFFFLFDTLLISGAMYFAFWSRFNGEIPSKYNETIFYYIGLAIVCKLFFLLLYNLYDISWRFVGLNELFKLFKAVSFGSLALGMSLYLLRLIEPFSATVFPRSVLVIDYLFSLVFIGGLRISKRVLLEGLKSTLKAKGPMRRVLIVGAGSAGEQIVRDMIREKSSHFVPVGFIDDDPSKRSIKIHGIKVLGKKEDIPRIIESNKIDEVLIAIPSAESKEIKAIVDSVREVKAMNDIKILPGTVDLVNGKVSLSDVKKVRLEDLLGREPVEIDYEAIKEFIEGKTVLVTGAGGSIGSEVVETASRFNPRQLIALDNDETELFYLENRIKHSDSRIIYSVGDIRDIDRVAEIFETYRPNIVIHAAAYKHVPLLESHLNEAVKTNILGTKILAEQSIKNKAEKFIFVSTDKAINPASVMGATKRCGEELLRALNLENKTEFVSVRFGNVLGSRGSVIPVFQEQIKRGGPVTVTHPEMKRYFMSTREAVLLTLEAASFGKGGEVFVLDMGEPVKIVDLAKEMIRLSGYEPDADIPIVFTESRPGEKMYEEILSAEEGTEPTDFEKIFIARNTKRKIQKDIFNKIDRMIQLSLEKGREKEILEMLKEIIPTYKSA